MWHLRTFITLVPLLALLETVVSFALICETGSTVTQTRVSCAERLVPSNKLDLLLQGRKNSRCFAAPSSDSETIAADPNAATDPPWTLGYEDSDTTSKGIVSSLTGLVNSFASISAGSSDQKDAGSSTETVILGDSMTPKTSQELLERLRDDYVVNNYLWTGKLDLACFSEDCTFTDPTLSFQGTAKYVENIQNLVPLVDRFCENTESRLLDIQLTDEYVETRWNMVGELNKLFWKPKIDVIGKTKFWFKHENDGLRIFFYDEAWEMPAYKALLQLVTPSGTK